MKILKETEIPKSILIVDDEEEIRENLMDFLEFKGFAVSGAGNGVEAMASLEINRPDMIISDLMMPEMSGMEFLKTLKDKKIDVPVVIMTAFGTIQYAIDAMKNGAVDFLTKPIDLSYTLQVIDRVIERGELHRKIIEQKRQLEEDLHHAARIQQCLLPKSIETDYFSLRFRFEPLMAIGGDYLTVHKYSDTKIAVAIYDVSGHGVSAALTGSLIHNLLIQLLEEENELQVILDQINQLLIHQIGKTGMFLTLVLAVIDLNQGTMTVSNAGHPELLIWRDDQTFERIESHIPPLGMLSNVLGDKNETIFPLRSKDRIIFYTDGLLETRTSVHEMLSKEGLENLFQSHSSLACKAFIEAVFQTLGSYHAGEPEDDMTMLVVDVK